MKRRKLKPIIVLMAGILFLFSSAGKSMGENLLTMDDFLAQVKSNNPDIKAANYSLDSMGKKVLEMDMVYSPFLSANYSWLDDQSGPGYGASWYPKEMKIDNWNFGFNKKFRTGSTLTAGYTNTFMNIDLLLPLNIFGMSYSTINGYNIKPFIRVEQSLLRDLMSGMTGAGIEKAKSAVKAGQYMQVFRNQQTMFRARSMYFMLALSREIVNFRKEELGRAETIMNWNENRVNMDLADKGDLLQTQALYKARQLGLQMALEDEKNACRDFNEIRGIPGDVINEELNKLSDIISSCSGVRMLSFTGERADVLSAKASFQSSEYAKKETFYRSLPDLTIYGMTSLYGLDMSYFGAADQIRGWDKPTYSIGANLIIPLDFNTLTKVKKGYELDFQSAKESLDKAEIGAKKDWIKLSENWNNVKSRLELAIQVRDIQAQRLENEHLKFKRGRTTTFQLLSAENDLNDATLNVYRMMMEELITYYQVELYNTTALKD